MKLATTSFFSAIISFIKVASGFIVGKILAIFTGAAGIALFGQFQNFINIILSISNGAINIGVIKYTAEFDNDRVNLQKLFSTSFKISIYCSILAGIILFSFSQVLSTWLFHTNLHVNVIRVLGLTIIFYSLNSLFISILNGKKEIRKYTIVNTTSSIVGLIFTIVLVYFFKIEGALYSLVLSQSIVFFVTAFLIYKTTWFNWTYFKHKFDKGFAYKLGHYSLMAIVSALTVPVSQLFIRNIVINKLGIDAAGFWQGVMRVSDGYLYLVTTAISTYYLPKLSSLHDKKELKAEVIGGYKLVLPTVFTGCCFVYFTRFIIIKTLYSHDFLAMESLFLYQLLGDFFKIAAWILSYLMLAKAMTKLFILTEIVFSVSYVVISIFCLNLWGLNGVTIAFAINYFIYLLFMLFQFRSFFI